MKKFYILLILMLCALGSLVSCTPAYKHFKHPVTEVNNGEVKVHFEVSNFVLAGRVITCVVDNNTDKVIKYVHVKYMGLNQFNDFVKEATRVPGEDSYSEYILTGPISPHTPDSFSYLYTNEEVEKIHILKCKVTFTDNSSIRVK